MGKELPKRWKRLKAFFLHRNVVLTVTVILFLLICSANEYMYFLEKQHRIDEAKKETLASATLLRSALEREINTTLNLTMGLVVYVAVHPNISDREFRQIAAELMKNTPHIRNVGLAENNVISHIYPLEGNEAALGLRYMDLPEQRDAVLRAIETGKTVIAGPVNLVQGGRAFISRIPIFTGMNRSRYWGIASIVIDIDSLYEASGILKPNLPLRLALRGKDGHGAEGAVFFGEEALFNDPAAVVMPIKLPLGHWLLAAAPKNVAMDDSPIPDLVRILGYLAALSISALLYTLLTAIRRNRFLALHDPLTGLANRRLFNAQLEHAINTTNRHGDPFAILFIDLDKFKPVNDTYGHDAGDIVLSTIAERLKEVTRDSDHIARVGGDEFIMILYHIGTIGNAKMVADKISDAIEMPITLSPFVSVRMKCSIGISLYPDDGNSADELIIHADSIMYYAKTGKKKATPERAPR